MTDYSKHVKSQGPVIKTLIRTAASGLKSGSGSKPNKLPGPELSAVVAPRPADLVQDYIRHVGGDQNKYGGSLPPHFYPQWGFPIISRTMENLPYNMTRVLNAGFSFEVKAPLPADQPLMLKACLEKLDDNGKRAIITQKLVSGTSDNPEALVARTTVFVPISSRGSKPSPKGPRTIGVGRKPVKAPRQAKEEPCVPRAAREIDRWQLSGRAGLEYAMLSGDFNPVHWVAPYARMSGFADKILHGFATAARAAEGLNRELWNGDPAGLKKFEVRFVKPLVLPASVGLYIDESNNFYVGVAQGGHANLVGSYNK